MTLRFDDHIFMELEDTFEFGKYKGETLDTVIDMDGQYVLWAVKVGIIQLDEDILKAIEQDEREGLNNEGMDEIELYRFCDVQDLY